MKRRLLCIFIILMFLPITSFGHNKVFTKTVKYPLNNSDSRVTAREKAMTEAQAALFQELGALVESRQKMTADAASGNNSKQDFSQEVKTYALGKVKTVVVKDKIVPNKKGDTVYSATFKMEVDMADLYRYLDNIVKQKENKRLAEIQKQQKIDGLRKEIDALKKEVEKAQDKENEFFYSFRSAEKRLAELKTQKDIAEKDYKRAVNASNATTSSGMERTKKAMDYLAETENKYDAQALECEKFEKMKPAAQENVDKARDNLYHAEVLLAEETGMPKPEKTADGDTKIINGIECVLVKAGTFTVGSPTSEANRDSDEMPYKVTMTQDYYISKYPITNAQYGESGNENHPVVNVTWFQASDWAKSIGGRLPTEAEWEFAARGGNKSQRYIYSGSNNLDAVGWYYNNSGGGTKPVGHKQPNELGIYDMSGNVWEWCSDWYGTYPTRAVTNPTGPSSGDIRVSRGGSWIDHAYRCRIADRDINGYPSRYDDFLGFRVVFPVEYMAREQAERELAARKE